MSKEIKELPGIALSEKDVSEKKVLSTEWDLKLMWAWDTGVGYGRYFAELKKGKIIGTRCHKCHRVLLPARAFCEWCFRPVDEWVYLKDTGTVETFSLSYLDPDARRITKPILIGVISIDGASLQHGFMHYFGEMKPEDLHIGMKVKAVWKPENEREGAITDIKYFKPFKGGRK